MKDFLLFSMLLTTFGYCQGSLISLTATPLIQSFTSHPGYNGITEYPVNYTQDWYITTNWINHTIKINFKTCHIENAKGKCLFDYLNVYDGSNSNSTQLLQTCCPTAPAAIVSSTGEIYLLFQTDHSVGDKGFEIEYWSNGITTTTTTTTVATTTTTSTSTATTEISNSSSAGANTGTTIYAQLESTDTSTYSNTKTSTRSIGVADKREDNTLYIIIACVVTLVLVVIVVILIVVVCLKKNNRANPMPKSFLVDDEPKKTNLAKTKLSLPVPTTPPLTTVLPQTNLFDLELPNIEKGRGHQLPPIFTTTAIHTLNPN